ncbi:hypothetical protein D3C72_832070 [compost metagenome]
MRGGRRIQDLFVGRFDGVIIRQPQRHAAHFRLVRDVGAKNLQGHGIARRACIGHGFVGIARRASLGLWQAEGGQVGASIGFVAGQRRHHGRVQARRGRSAMAATRFAPQQVRRQGGHRLPQVFKHGHLGLAQGGAALRQAGIDGDEQARMLARRLGQGIGHAVQHVAGCVDDHRVDGVGGGQGLQHRAHEVGVVDHVAGHVHRVADHAVIGNAAAQHGLQVFGQIGQVQARADELVGQDRAQRARHRQHRHALAGAAVAQRGQTGQVRHLRKVGGFNHVQLAKCRRVHAPVAGQRRRVRTHGLRALVGVAGLQCNQQLALAFQFAAGAHEAFAVPQLFDIAQHDFRARIARQVFQILREIQAGFIAGVDEMRERQVKPARNGVHRRAHIAALRQQADHARPGLRRRGLEHRRKRRVRLRVQVGETHAVGPGHGHAALRHEGFQFVLQAYALTARFRKTRRIDDGRAHALGVAAAQHGRDVGRGNRQHRQVHRFGHGFNVGPAALAEHFLVLRVDRIDAARVAKARQ